MQILTKDTSSGKHELNITMKQFLVVICLTILGFGESQLLSEVAATSKPTHFVYQAERYPGHVDRVHEESNDGSGHIQGFFSYIDPKHQLRTVDYTADKDGFHPTLINFDDLVNHPRDSEAVILAKENHFRLYERVANRQSVPASLPRDTAAVVRAKEKHFQLFNKIAQEHAAIAEQREAERAAVEATSIANDVRPEHIIY